MPKWRLNRFANKRSMTGCSEGKATFQVGQSFYNPQSRMIRDLGVLAAAVHRQEIGQLRVLDAMASAGVRSLRYALESGADWVWVNEGNPDIQATLQQNLAATLPSDRYQLTQWDANRVFFDCYNRQDFYDLVDVDSFGSASPYASTSLWSIAIGGLLYLTSTNGRILTGHAPQQSLSTYGAYARSHPAANEQALRLLLGTVQQQAAAKGLGVEPLFAFFAGQTYRVMVRLVRHSLLQPNTYGFLGYCHTCGDYQVIYWQQLGQCRCPQHSNLSVSGPLWLGALHNPLYLEKMKAIAAQWQWTRAAQLLDLMIEESPLPPYFYLLKEIGRRGKLDLPPRSHLIQTLQGWGYQAGRTHLHPQAIKTNADLPTCIQAARST